ncbi:MAG: RNA polymerase sigma factor [Clostridiales Family XIII bacterium]|jgi:RNA polymerase sigma-70 factor (ECF subfamily)|nr:RNA polymerase sigma factor [Clostridiales Family XIII bacterium]
MAEAHTIELARKASKGNRRAFNELCETKSRSMIFTALGILGNLEDAEDAVQEAFLTMFKSMGQLKTPEAVDVWIYQIVRSRCLRSLEKRAKTMSDLDIDDETLVQPPVTDNELIPEKYAEDQEMGRRLYEVILGLPVKRREAIIMFYYDGLSVKEIAAVTGTTINAVTSTLSKAKVMIRERLEEEEKQDMEKDALTAGAAPVISRVLMQQFQAELPDAALNAFNHKWMALLQAAKFPAAKSALTLKVATVAISAATVTGGGAAISHYMDTSNTALLAATASIENIALAGDCDCGHLNPHYASIDISAADLEGITVWWKITPEDSPEVLYTGAGNEVSSELDVLEDGGAQGRYTLTFAFDDKVGNRVEKARDFEID